MCGILNSTLLFVLEISCGYSDFPVVVNIDFPE